MNVYLSTSYSKSLETLSGLQNNLCHDDISAAMKRKKAADISQTILIIFGSLRYVCVWWGRGGGKEDFLWVNKFRLNRLKHIFFFFFWKWKRFIFVFKHHSPHSWKHGPPPLPPHSSTFETNYWQRHGLVWFICFSDPRSRGSSWIVWAGPRI